MREKTFFRLKLKELFEFSEQESTFDEVKKCRRTPIFHVFFTHFSTILESFVVFYFFFRIFAASYENRYYHRTARNDRGIRARKHPRKGGKKGAG